MGRYFITMRNRSHSKRYTWVGYCKCRLFFLLNPLAFTRQKLQLSTWFFSSLQTICTQNLSFAFIFLKPGSQCFNTRYANLVRCPTFVQVTKRYSEISKINSFHRTIDITSLRWKSKTTTAIAKNIWVTATLSSFGSHRHVKDLMEQIRSFKTLNCKYCETCNMLKNSSVFRNYCC